jgi:hypothetical protein
MIRGEGLRVAAVDAQGRVHLRPIKIGRNFGQSVEVLEGVSLNDQLVLNPSDSISEGDKVAIAPAAKDTGTKGVSATAAPSANTPAKGVSAKAASSANTPARAAQ